MSATPPSSFAGVAAMLALASLALSAPGAAAQRVGDARVAVVAHAPAIPILSTAEVSGVRVRGTPLHAASSVADSVPEGRRGCGGPWRPTLGILGAAVGMGVIGKWAIARSHSVESSIGSAIAGPVIGMVIGGMVGSTIGERVDCRRARRRGPAPAP